MKMSDDIKYAKILPNASAWAANAAEHVVRVIDSSYGHMWRVIDTSMYIEWAECPEDTMYLNIRKDEVELVDPNDTVFWKRYDWEHTPLDTPVLHWFGQNKWQIEFFAGFVPPEDKYPRGRVLTFAKQQTSLTAKEIEGMTPPCVHVIIPFKGNEHHVDMRTMQRDVHYWVPIPGDYSRAAVLRNIDVSQSLLFRGDTND